MKLKNLMVAVLQVIILVRLLHLQQFFNLMKVLMMILIF